MVLYKNTRNLITHKKWRFLIFYSADKLQQELHHLKIYVFNKQTLKSKKNLQDLPKIS